MRYNLIRGGSEGFNMPELLLLGDAEIEGLLSMAEALEIVENAFKLKAEGKTVMPPKLYLALPQYQGDFRAMPACINGSAGIKWVSVYPNNWVHNLPSVIAIIILCDPNTGCPLALMDGTYITSIRTGAAGGVAVKHLSGRSSSIVGIIGAGMQAKTQLLAISKVLPGVEEVKVFDQHKDARLRYAEAMGTKLNINVHPVETIRDAAAADIVVTTTPSRKPIIDRQYIRPGTHINAIGADAPGKQELDTEILKHAKVFVDDMAQASHSGEINVSLSKGLIKVEQVYCTLGEVVAHRKKGRESDEEITIFNSTGLAIQDIACAKFVYDKAKDRCASQ